MAYVQVSMKKPHAGRIKAIKTPGSNSQLLTDTSKMPAWSFSLPAGNDGGSCPGAVYGEGSICGVCYAQKGRYAGDVVQNAQHIRYDWTLECLMTQDGRDLFVRTMIDSIRETGLPYFRGHDSGDFFNPKYVDCWRRICEALPHVKFWFPTRSYRLVRIAAMLLQLSALPNVTVRPSALYFEEAPPMIEGFAAGTSASKDNYNCPAHDYANTCGPCRVCWDEPETAVVYRMH